MEFDTTTLKHYHNNQRYLFLSELCLNLAKKSLERIIRKYGLSHSQYLVLMIVGYADLTNTNVISTEISYLLGREKHSITPVVESLVKAGYIIRGKDSSDRRIINLILTDEGKKIIREIQPLTISTIADIPVGSQKEFDALFKTLELFRNIYAKKCGIDPELFREAFDRLLVKGGERLSEELSGRKLEER